MRKFECTECGYKFTRQVWIRCIYGLTYIRKITFTFPTWCLRSQHLYPAFDRHLCDDTHRSTTSVENYNPRQRRLRNLVVEDESAAASSSPPSQAEAQAGPADMVNLVIQPEAVVVEQVHLSLCWRNRRRAGHIFSDWWSSEWWNRLGLLWLEGLMVEWSRLRSL